MKIIRHGIDQKTNKWFKGMRFGCPKCDFLIQLDGSEEQEPIKSRNILFMRRYYYKYNCNCTEPKLLVQYLSDTEHSP